MSKILVYTDISHQPRFDYYGSAWIQTTEKDIIDHSMTSVPTSQQPDYSVLEAQAIMDWAKQYVGTHAEIVVLTDNKHAVDAIRNRDIKFLDNFDKPTVEKLLRLIDQGRATVKWTRGIRIGKDPKGNAGATFGHKIAHKMSRQYNDKDKQKRKLKDLQKAYQPNYTRGLHVSNNTVKNTETTRYRDEWKNIGHGPTNED